MDLTNDFSQIPMDDDQYYLNGEVVKIVRRGKDSVRIERSDGEQIKIPWSALQRNPGGDSNPMDPVEMAARSIEIAATKEKKKFVKLMLIEGQGVTAVDRNFFQYGKYPEIKTRHQLELLTNRLRTTGMFSKVVAGVDQGTNYPQMGFTAPPQF